MQFTKKLAIISRSPDVLNIKERMPGKMSIVIATRSAGKFLVVEVKGRIGGESSIEFYRTTKEILTDSLESDIIIDFSQVDFIDSSGLGSLVAINSHLVKNDRRLILSGVMDSLMGLLKITNLISILTIVKTVEDALQR